MTTECPCEQWEVFMPALDGAVFLAWSHDMWPKDFVPFKYCPWCGSVLVTRGPDSGTLENR